MSGHGKSLDHSYYVEVAASQGNAVLTEGTGTVLYRIIIVPATTAPGAVTIHDGNGTGEDNIAVYTGGTVGADLTPIVIDFGPHGIRARNKTGTLTSEGWFIDTGANMTVIACVQHR